MAGDDKHDGPYDVTYEFDHLYNPGKGTHWSGRRYDDIIDDLEVRVGKAESGLRAAFIGLLIAAAAIALGTVSMLSHLFKELP